MHPAPPPPALVALLRRTVAGPVTYPADPGWAALVADLDDPATGSACDPPTAVVQAASDDDVVAATAAALRHGLALNPPTPWLRVLVVPTAPPTPPTPLTPLTPEGTSR